MAKKLVPRFHANFLRITMDYGGKEETVNKQNQHQVPEMPKMVWRENRPSYSHLEADQPKTTHRKNVNKDQMKVPQMPTLKWLPDGRPDYSHLE